tara:strand:- start:15 stop:242 length:228 start_codon:yes stop_codon:yes gene_type:complete
MLENKKLVIKCHQQMIIIDREIKSIAKANPWIISEPSKSTCENRALFEKIISGVSKKKSQTLSKKASGNKVHILE